MHCGRCGDTKQVMVPCPNDDTYEWGSCDVLHLGPCPQCQGTHREQFIDKLKAKIRRWLNG